VTSPRTTGFPSIPRALVGALGDKFPGNYVATRFPGPDDPDGDVQTIVAAGNGVVRVTTLGGSRDKHNATQRVAIDVIEADEGRAEDLAESICTYLLDTRPIRGGGLMLDGADVEVAPHEVPYADPSIAQFSATYAVQTRRLEAR
jgi:hypothetical protein